MSRLTTLIKKFYANILRDYLEGTIKPGIHYFYFLEASHVSLMALDQKASWKEDEFTAIPCPMEASIEYPFSQNGSEFNYIVSQKGMPHARIFINPHLSFSIHGFVVTGTLDQDFIIVYERDMPLDKFMIRRIEKSI